MKVWHEIIGGFLQNQGTLTGMIKLWADIHAKCCKPGHTNANFSPWNSNWKHRAEHISRFSAEEPIILVYAYSWGAGWGARQLAKELDKRGLEIRMMILSDPVYRHPYWLGNWRAFWPYSVIKFPPNVNEISYYIQRIDWPRGHKVEGNKVHNPVEVSRGHRWMDEAPEFLRECLFAAETLG